VHVYQRLSCQVQLLQQLEHALAMRAECLSVLWSPVCCLCCCSAWTRLVLWDCTAVLPEQRFIDSIVFWWVKPTSHGICSIKAPAGSCRSCTGTGSRQ
jgi:hypothetical protein